MTPRLDIAPVNRPLEVETATCDPDVLERLRRVPRDAFDDVAARDFMCATAPRPAGTLSELELVALMLEAAQVKPGDHVLDIGDASGYMAAVISQTANKVYVVMRHPALVAAAQERFHTLGYDNIELRAGDGTEGWPEAAPFDAILVQATAVEAPRVLKEQLAIFGRLVMRVGEEAQQRRLVKLTRRSRTEFEPEALGP
jgi:protein-L-isoaspartate(D-aspartate) O-methyltransferase